MNKSSKGFAHLFVIIILALVTVAGIGYYAYKNGQVRLTPQQAQPSPTPTTDQVANQVTNGDLANWKTYRNTKYAFSFEYPPNLYLRKDSTHDFAGFLTDPNKNSSQRLIVTVLSNPQNLNLEEFDTQNKPIPYDWEDLSLENKRINSYEAIIKKFEQPCVGLCQNYKFERSFVVRIKGDGFVVSFTVDNRIDPSNTSQDEKWLDQILFTFKFLDGGTISGRVTENRLDCHIDGLCYLLVDTGSKTVRVIYHYGEWPPCTNESAAQDGEKTRVGSIVEIYGSLKNTNEISTCDSEEYYIREI